MTRTILSLGFLLAVCVAVPSASAEFRSAKDMQKECRVALKVMDGSLFLWSFKDQINQSQ